MNRVDEPKESMDLDFVRIVKETEKAAEVEIQIAVEGDDKYRNWKIWLPKSQVFIGDGVISLPRWLLQAKKDEVCDYFGKDVKIKGARRAT